MRLRHLGLGAVFVLLAGCDSSGDLVWAQFNADGDVLPVEVGTDQLGPPVATDLHSSTGQHVVGQAVVDPGSGPVGTRHQLVVTVSDEFDPSLQDDDDAGDPLVARVQRVSVEVDSGPLGVQSWDLKQDSAAQQTWVVELESLGDPESDVRTDVFTILLWEAVTRGEAESSPGAVEPVEDAAR